MRNGSVVLLICALLLAVALVPAGAQATSGGCGDVVMFPKLKQSERFKARVVVRNTSCAKGRAVARHWFAANKAAKTTVNRRRLDGYTCVFSTGKKYQVRCAAGGRVVRATWGPRY